MFVNPPLPLLRPSDPLNRPARARAIRLALLALWLALLGPDGRLFAEPASAHRTAPQSFLQTPLHFEENVGQTDPEAKFLARGRGYSIFLTAHEAVLALRTPDHANAQLRLRLEGANAQPCVEGLETLPGRVSYFRGADAARWHGGVPTCARVKYEAVYPGIDLVYYGNQSQLEYDFVIAPGCDPKLISLRFEGADKLELDEKGDLVVQLPGGKLRWHKPMAYQNLQGGRREIACACSLQNGNRLGFAVAAYDHSQPLTIDPVLVYSSYLGGSDFDEGLAVAVDGSGNFYLTGETLSVDFPTTGNTFHPAVSGGNEIFVTKFQSNGTALVYSTYLGGSGSDFGKSIAVDSSGKVYLAGQTDSADFPTTNAFQSSLSGGFGVQDAFLTVLGAAGTNLIYSTYLGGPGFESANGVAVDFAGNAYIVGETDSGLEFPATHAFQASPGGSLDAFVAKFNPSAAAAASLLYASWIGGGDNDRGTAIAVDSSGNAYVTGEIFSFDASTSSFPTTTNAWQSRYGGGASDAFVVKVNAAGSTLLFSSFLGGNRDDSGFGIALDPSRNVYVAGSTASTNFSTVNAAQPVIGGATDAFVAKLNATGNNLLYASFLGGAQDDFAQAIAVNGHGLAFITGQTTSTNFPLTEGADQLLLGGLTDAFVARLNPAVAGPASLIYATYLGGSDEDAGNSITVDRNDFFYVAGTMTSTDVYTTPEAYQPSFGGSADAFVAKYISSPDLSLTEKATPNPVTVNTALTLALKINNNSGASITGVTMTDVLPVGARFVSVSASQGSCTVSAGTVTCQLGTLSGYGSAAVEIVIVPRAPGPLTNSATLSAGASELNLANNNATATAMVQALPKLAIEFSGNYSIISWAEGAEGFQLEFSSTLGASANWATVTTAPIATAGRIQVTLNVSPGQKFFRLVHP